MSTIEFIAHSDNAITPPTPMNKSLPNWYKEIDSYVGGVKGNPLKREGIPTIKKCMPILDVLSAGYLMTTQVDLFTKIENGTRIWYWAANATPEIESVQLHSAEQVTGLPKLIPNKKAYKLDSPWGIRTPKGYSTLFLPPLYRDAPIFEIFAGIVDTDNFQVPVNHPFYLLDENFEGLIPHGTPLAQVIPFKRDSWESKVIYSEAEKLNMSKQLLLQARNLWNGYKKAFWVPKSYK